MMMIQWLTADRDHEWW